MRLLEHRHLGRSVVALHHQAAMGLQVARPHLRGPDYREFTVSISLLMHPGSYVCVLTLCLAANFSLDFTTSTGTCRTLGGGGGGGGGEEDRGEE